MSESVDPFVGPLPPLLATPQTAVAAHARYILQGLARRGQDLQTPPSVLELLARLREELANRGSRGWARLRQPVALPRFAFCSWAHVELQLRLDFETVGALFDAMAALSDGQEAEIEGKHELAVAPWVVLPLLLGHVPARRRVLAREAPRACAQLGLDPDGVDLAVLSSRCLGDFRTVRWIEIESGIRAARACCIEPVERKGRRRLLTTGAASA